MQPWRADRAGPAGPPLRHEGLQDLVFRADGRVLLTQGRDVAKVRDLSGRRSLGLPLPHGGPAAGLRATGDHLFTSGGQEVYVWPAARAPIDRQYFISRWARMRTGQRLERPEDEAADDFGRWSVSDVPDPQAIGAQLKALPGLPPP